MEPAILQLDPPSAAADAARPARGQDARQLRELADLVRAYHEVTQKLQASHEALRQEVARLEEQLASKDAQLQRSRRLAALGEMAAGIAHEVRNPLAAIQLYADIIRQDLDGVTGAGRGRAALKECAQTAAKIVDAVRGLDGVVRDVLAFARELSPRPVDVNAAAAFARALAALKPMIEAGAVESVCDPAAEGVEVRADADLLQQALVNVMRNAVEAMTQPPRPGAPRQLFLAARPQGRRAVLSVRDTGPGIDAQDIDRLFNPFFTTRAAGTGLGLAIVHRIVDAHGGTIAAAQHPEGGALFELSLPCGGADAGTP